MDDDFKLDRRRFLELGGAGIAGASLLGFAAHAAPPAYAEPDGLQPAPDRKPGEGRGPFRKLVIRGGTLIDGTGAAPRGPVDILVVDQVIKQITPAGAA